MIFFGTFYENSNLTFWDPDQPIREINKKLRKYMMHKLIGIGRRSKFANPLKIINDNYL